MCNFVLAFSLEERDRLIEKITSSGGHVVTVSVNRLVFTVFYEERG